MSRLTKWQELFHETGIINLNENHVRWAVKQFFKEYKIRLPKNIPWDLVMTKRKVFVNDFYSIQIIDEEFVKLPELVLWLGNAKRIIATVYPASIRDNKISKNMNKMEIYLNPKKELEIKSLEKEPWIESELIKFFGLFTVERTKLAYKTLGFTKLILDTYPTSDIARQIRTIKVVSSEDGEPIPCHKMIWPPYDSRTILEDVIKPFVEHNFDAS